MLLFSKFKIKGHSMEPTFKDNELIIVSFLPFIFKKININDIVAISYNNQVIIKRIKKIIDNKFYVQGDNNKDSLDSSEFGLIARKQILGKVLFKL